MIYDEIDLEEMQYDKESNLFTYPCPCGDRFEVSLDDLINGVTEIATCPNCGLEIQVLYQMVCTRSILGGDMLLTRWSFRMA